MPIDTGAPAAYWHELRRSQAVPFAGGCIGQFVVQLQPLGPQLHWRSLYVQLSPLRPVHAAWVAGAVAGQSACVMQANFWSWQVQVASGVAPPIAKAPAV